MKTIVTGGAGFIGSNASSRYLKRGHQVVVVDNLSRDGVAENLEWLRSLGGELEFHQIDVRESGEVSRVFREHRDADQVLHLAAQVAVTTSVKDPREDFEINALGTFNVLEALRQSKMRAPLIYSSTNKVYGEMTGVGTVERNGRYDYHALPTGVSEDHNLDFHSPYGCSKGSADQYAIDYHRITRRLRHLYAAQLHKLSPYAINLHRVDALHQRTRKRIFHPKQNPNHLHQISSLPLLTSYKYVLNIACHHAQSCPAPSRHTSSLTGILFARMIPARRSFSFQHMSCSPVASTYALLR